MINNVVLVGRITKDIELKYTSTNIPKVDFTLAVSRPFKGQNGEQETDFIRCIAFRKQAENMARYLNKGNQIGVTGRIQTRSYQDNAGKMQYITEVVADNVTFLESKQQRGQQQQGQFNQGYNQQNNGFTTQEQPNAMNFIQQPQQNVQNGYNQQQMQMGSTGIANNNNLWTDYGNGFNDADFQDVPNPFKED